MELYELPKAMPMATLGAVSPSALILKAVLWDMGKDAVFE